MARPRKEIDQEQFEKLCAMQCTKDEICGFFDDIDEKTLTGWCKRTYGEGFSDVFKKKSANGKISLRRYQFELAKRNATMAIWLGKQHLGQRDEVEIDAMVSSAEDELSKSLREMAKELKSDE